MTAKLNSGSKKVRSKATGCQSRKNTFLALQEIQKSIYVLHIYTHKHNNLSWKTTFRKPDESNLVSLNTSSLTCFVHWNTQWIAMTSPPAPNNEPFMRKGNAYFEISEFEGLDQIKRHRQYDIAFLPDKMLISSQFSAEQFKVIQLCLFLSIS